MEVGVKSQYQYGQVQSPTLEAALSAETDSTASLEEVPATSPAERAVADLLPIGAPTLTAARIRDAVPIWFHTFQLAPGIYTPGIARDHRYRLPALEPARFAGRRVLDIGTLRRLLRLPRRGARRRAGRRRRQRAVRRLGAGALRRRARARPRASAPSTSCWARGSPTGGIDVLDVAELGETLRRGALLRDAAPRDRPDRGAARARGRARARRRGRARDARLDGWATACPRSRSTTSATSTPGDDYVYWGFGPRACGASPRLAGFDRVEIVDQVEIDGHPRIIAVLRAAV